MFHINLFYSNPVRCFIWFTRRLYKTNFCLLSVSSSARNEIFRLERNYGRKFSFKELQAKRRFEEMLDCLRNGTEFSKASALVDAPFLARLADDNQRKSFIDFSGEWWNRAQKELSQRKFRVHFVISNLAELNDESEGILFKKIDAERVLGFLLGRWMEIGLDAYKFENVLAGLFAINKFCSTKSTKRMVVDSTRVTRWNEFFEEFERFWIKKNETFTSVEFDRIVDTAMGVEILRILRRLRVTPSQDAMRLFNRWALFWLRKYSKRRLDATDFDDSRFRSYAYAWIGFRQNPELFALNSWHVWYAAFARSLTDAKYNAKPIRVVGLSLPPSVAHYFDRVSDLLKIFDIWNGAILSCIDDVLENQNDFFGDLAEILFSTGLVIRHHVVPVDARRKFNLLAAAIMDKFCTADVVAIPQQIVVKAIFGYMNTRQPLSADVELPKKVSSFLQRWCASVRQSGKNDQLTSARVVSDIFYSLSTGNVKSPDALIDEITATFFWGLPSARDLTNCLWNYGAACCLFSYDPSRTSALGDRAWQIWFHHTHEILKRQCLDFEQGDHDFQRLLQVALQVALVFQRFKEFKALQPYWEKCVLNELLSFKKDDLRTFYHHVKDLEMKNVRIGLKLSDSLYNLYAKSMN